MRKPVREFAKSVVVATLIACGIGFGRAGADDIPLPEHPRPDFQRADWINLNGDWAFRFDKANAGLADNWATGKTEFPLTIKVPFPWGSKLSGVKDEADIAWYRRTVQVPAAWKGQARVPGGRRQRLAHHRLARRPRGRQQQGWIHALRTRSDRRREVGRTAAARLARR